MINDPKMIKKLLEEFNSIPDEIIKKAIKEVIEEEEQSIIEEVFEINESERYKILNNYNYSNEFNIYIHNERTSRWSNIFKRKGNENDENVEVA